MRSLRLTRVFMDTTVTAEVVGEVDAPVATGALERAFGWFAEVEARCSRFDPASEVRELALQPGAPVRVSPLLCSTVAFALEVARASSGAFDPTLGARMEQRGLDRDYRTRQRASSGLRPEGGVSWRDVEVDADASTITLARPLLLDLGAVAKGLAIDLALRELAGYPGAAVDAGGDIAVRGTNADGGLWRIGIRHPRTPGAVYTRVCLGEGAVCTSGDYERRALTGGSHIMDPRSGEAADAVASCTVVAPSAMLADALGTAATVLGPRRAIPWLGEQGVEGLILTPGLNRHATPGFGGLEQCP